MMSENNKEIQAIYDAMKGAKETRMFKRYQTISLKLTGEKIADIAKIVGISKRTVNNYWQAYQKGGLEGLIPKKQPGAIKKLTDEQEAELLKVIIDKTPEDVGFKAAKNWTSEIIRDHILNKYDVEYTTNGVTKMLHRLGMSYTQPTYTLKKADPAKQEQFKEKFKELKKKLINGEIDHILFQDETMIRDYQAINRTWFLKGNQRLIPTYGKHWGVKIIGTLDYETGEVFCVEEESYNAEVFLKFLKSVLKKYPEGKIVMILDNSRVHHAKLLKPFLKENKDRLELVFLPPYSPQLNLIEGLWKWLKERVIYNVFYENVNQIKTNVQSFINYVNENKDKVIQRLCVQM